VRPQGSLEIESALRPHIIIETTFIIIIIIITNLIIITN